MTYEEYLLKINSLIYPEEREDYLRRLKDASKELGLPTDHELVFKDVFLRSVPIERFYRYRREFYARGLDTLMEKLWSP